MARATPLDPLAYLESGQNYCSDYELVSFVYTRLDSYPLSGYTVTGYSSCSSRVSYLVCFVWIHFEFIVEDSENLKGSQLRRS